MLLWPLILMSVFISSIFIVIVNGYLYGLQGVPQDQETDEGSGLGFIILCFIFLVLYGLLHEGEGYELGVTVFVILFFTLYEMLY